MHPLRWLKAKFKKSTSSRINHIYVRLEPRGEKIPGHDLKLLSSEKKIYSVIKVAGDIFQRGSQNYDPVLLLEREIQFIQALGGHPFFPKIISSGKTEFEIAYAGVRISKENAPVDFDSQVESILASLEQSEIIHRDIKAQNVLVHEGQITLIDFGWAIRKGEKLPCPQDNEPTLSKDLIYDNRRAFEHLKKNLR